jgi:ABC-type maltose transport system permease subunit
MLVNPSISEKENLSQQDNESFCSDLRDRGLPACYPKPKVEDMLFYIQNNHNQNTVVYKINRLSNRDLNQNCPIYAFWSLYDGNKKEKDLNHIQNTLAYGYTHDSINQTLIEIQFVSFKKVRFFLKKEENNNFSLITTINGTLSKLTNIYVYAEEFGVFPDVKFLEMFGVAENGGQSTYQRYYIDN